MNYIIATLAVLVAAAAVSSHLVQKKADFEATRNKQQKHYRIVITTAMGEPVMTGYSHESKPAYDFGGRRFGTMRISDGLEWATEEVTQEECKECSK